MLGTSSETGTKERIGFASRRLLLVSLAIDDASAIGDARLDRSYRMNRLHFLGRSKRAFGQLRSFLDLGPKLSCPLNDLRIGFGVANFEIIGHAGPTAPFL